MLHGWVRKDPYFLSFIFIIVLRFRLHGPCFVGPWWPILFIIFIGPTVYPYSYLEDPEIKFSLPRYVSVLSSVLFHSNHGGKEGRMLWVVWWILVSRRKLWIGIITVVSIKSMGPHGPMKHGLFNPNKTFVYLFLYKNKQCLRVYYDIFEKYLRFHIDHLNS